MRFLDLRAEISRQNLQEIVSKLQATICSEEKYVFMDLCC